MSYKEKDFQGRFNKWLKYHWMKKSAAFELKICKKKSLSFSAVKSHQIDGLLHAKHGSVVKKLSDIDPAQKPFDCFILANVMAFVVILFYEPRKQKEAFLIDIDDFVEERDKSNRKSITKERGAELSKYIIRI